MKYNSAARGFLDQEVEWASPAREGRLAIRAMLAYVVHRVLLYGELPGILVDAEPEVFKALKDPLAHKVLSGILDQLAQEDPQ